ncbi:MULTISPECIES: TIGR03086 family metal-binding protein [unclassified Pseudofrankia]|uniref:TIGR03086 family metal-binding protein n=1 Tax=unclassified Pseudofrankia TaxID=2994372 RepID=UPI000B2138BC|nr:MULTISPECIES: TIGR03086 family metal-binding protein [unclassified Pseudofrankia]MDT3440725.1 TIGR03086 family metal-binding protein [Pseudofrankia sp. BMG5.37]
MEIFDALDRAVASTSGIVKTVRPDQLSAATPCTEWDIRALLNHLVGTLWLGEALFTDGAPRHPMPPGGLPATDLVGDDPAVAYETASAALLAAARVGDTLTRIHTTPLGDMPGPALAGFTTLDILVHGWDLASATGQPTSLDDDLAGHVLAFASQAITDDFRGTRIGPAIPVEATASVTDRLVGFLGRQP